MPASSSDISEVSPTDTSLILNMSVSGATIVRGDAFEYQGQRLETSLEMLAGTTVGCGPQLQLHSRCANLFQAAALK